MGGAATASGEPFHVGYQQSFGFWSVLGDLPVPIRLQVDKSVQAPLTVELEWSGATERFELYRAFAPQDLVVPQNLALVTSQCVASDENASASDIIYYSVVPSSSD